MIVAVAVVVTVIKVYGQGHSVMLPHGDITLLVQGVCVVKRRNGRRAYATHIHTHNHPLVPFSARLPEFLPQKERFPDHSE